MTIEKISIEDKEWKEQQKDIFSNPEEQFSQLKNEENISKGFYLNQIKEFEDKTWEQWKQVLNHLQVFLLKNKIDDVKWQLATMMFIENLIEKKWDNAEKIVKLLENKKPILLLKFINNFIYDVIKLEKKADKLEKKADKLGKKEDKIKKESLKKQWIDDADVDKELNKNIKIVVNTLVSKYHFSEYNAKKYAKNVMVWIKRNEDVNKIMQNMERMIFSQLRS